MGTSVDPPERGLEKENNKIGSWKRAEGTAALLDGADDNNARALYYLLFRSYSHTHSVSLRYVLRGDNTIN